MHLDAEQIEGLLSGEPPEQRVLEQRDHLARCEACAEAYEAAARRDAEIARLLRQLDHRIPQVDPASLRRRARRRVLRPRLAAAGIVILLAVGAASAMPGSPVRSWISKALAVRDELGADSAGGQVSDSVVAPAGVSVPAADSFALVFEATQASGRAIVVLADQQEVSVRSDAAGVGYSIEPWGVLVLNAGSLASYEIVVPGDLPTFSLRVKESIVFQKRGQAILTSAQTDGVGRYVIELGPSSPR